jgi:hypothetical protein
MELPLSASRASKILPQAIVFMFLKHTSFPGLSTVITLKFYFGTNATLVGEVDFEKVLPTAGTATCAFPEPAGGQSSGWLRATCKMPTKVQ